MGKRNNPRRSNSSRRNKARRRFAAAGLPCALCGRSIDYDRPSRYRVGGRWVWDDYAFELDEIVPVSRWAEFGYASPEACANDPSNQQPAHRICNRKKSNSLAPPRQRVSVRADGDVAVAQHSQQW